MTNNTMIMLGSYLVVLAMLSVILVWSLWPPAERIRNDKTNVRILGSSVAIGREKQILLIVLLMGFIGGCAWALWWFAFNAAQSGLKDAHISWYLLRPWTSCLISLIFYGLVRSGLFVANLGNGKDINVYGIAGLAGAVGFLANEIFSKLESVVK